MKNILIFYGSYGGGHLSAAKSIKECLEENYDDIKVEMYDCIEYINKFLNKVTTKAYANMAKKAPRMWKGVYTSSQNGILSKISNTANKLMANKLGKLILNIKPDLIISTHPFSSQMCAILRQKNKINCKIATVMTDYAPHNQWLINNGYIDYFFVAHKGMKDELIKKNIPEFKIYDTGIPLSNRFLKDFNKNKILEEFNLLPNKTTVLFFAGGKFGLGQHRTCEILETLIDLFPNMQIVAISGKNLKMKEDFERIVNLKKAENSVKVLDYTNKIPELMSISNFVITKPGRSYNNRESCFSVYLLL